jgi:hypothetical protein
MFEEATRKKFRFEYYGTITVEDLWDLPIETLDKEIFKPLNSQLKQTEEESLLDIQSKEDEELNAKIEIVKHIVKVKQEEAQFAVDAKERADQRQKIMEALAAKKDESLKSMSEDELEEALNKLSG